MKLNEYNDIISKYTYKYENIFLNIKKRYTTNLRNMTTYELKKLLHEYKLYVKRFINELIDEFDEMKKYKFIALLSGSFSKDTNTLFSDIDLNIFYDNIFNEEMLQFEFKINYVIQKVMRYRGIDRIHTMAVYLPLISNNKYEYISNNRYPLYFDDATIYFFCRENSEELMYELYNSTRNIHDIINHLNNNDNIDNLNEWTNCFELVYDNGLYDIFLKNRKICKNKTNINSYIEKVKKMIDNDNNYFDYNITDVKISDLKYYYKTLVTNNIYFLFATLFRLNKDINMINIYEFIKNNIFEDKFYVSFYKYLDCIQRLCLVLDYKELDLSSHSKKIVSIKDLNNIYYEISGKNNIIDDMNKAKKELYDISKKSLLKINKRNDK